MYDLTIVGGGIAGTSLAFSFARHRPSATCLLIEKNKPGSGASAFSAGFDAVECADRRLRALALRSRQLYLQMQEDIPAARVQRLATLWVTTADETAGFPERFVLEGQTSAMISRVHPPRLPAPFRHAEQEAVFCEETSGYADVGAIARETIGWLRKRPNFACWESTHAVEFNAQPDGADVVLSDGRRIRTRKLVLATGPWLGEPAAAAFVPSNLRTKKIACLMIASRPVADAPAVVYGHEGAFFMPLHDQAQWLFCFTLRGWDCVPGQSMQLTPAELSAGIAQLRRLAPELAGHVAGAQVFCDTYTADRYPLCAAHPAMPHVFVLGGCSGAGYRYAPALAEKVLESLNSISQPPGVRGEP